MRAFAAFLLFCGAASCGGRNIVAGPDAGDAAAPSSPEADAQDTVVEGPGDVGQDITADAASDVAADAGQDGPTDTEAVDGPSVDGVPGPGKYKAIAITSGRYHVCALLEDHRVKCWGSNSYGQLGLGDTKTRSFPNEMGDNLPTVDLGTGRTAKTITAGRYATCALLDDSSVKCWGWAALAVGAKNPTPAAEHLGDAPGEMGDALPRIDLGPGRTARSITMGFYTGCAVRDDETARCWGSLFPTEDRPAPSGGRHIVQVVGTRSVAARYDDGSLGVIFDGEVPTPPAGSPPGLKAVTLAGNTVQACAIFEGNVLSCTLASSLPSWPATFAAPVVELALMELGARCWRFADGIVQCRGAGSVWAVDDTAADRTVRLGQPAVALTSGGLQHTCALLADGDVKCWGEESNPYSAQGGSVATATSWPSVNLGTRPAP